MESQRFTRGNIKLSEKALKELQDIFQFLTSKLKELNEDAVRERKYDYPILNEAWLNKTLKDKIPLKEKKRLLLTQIGYLRINIFTEYFERVNLLREKNKLDEAVDLMNQHAAIARIFIPTKRQSPLVKRLKELLSVRNTEPIEYLQQWQNLYQAWLKETPHEQFDKKKRTEIFDKLKKAFLELYTFSFSVANFPPLANRRSDQ